MKIKVIAKSNKEVYAGVDNNDEYVVFSLDDIHPIELGDTLTGTFDNSDGLFKHVRNITQNREVKICTENWGCNRDNALETLKRLNSPSEIFTL